mgnify:CR=1 FL=1
MKNHYPQVIFYTANSIVIIFFIEKQTVKILKKISAYQIGIEYNHEQQPTPVLKIDKLTIPLSLIDINFLEKTENASLLLYVKPDDNLIAQLFFEIKADISFILECRAIEKALEIKNLNKINLDYEHDNTI